jgi:hypothetical protein
MEPHMTSRETSIGGAPGMNGSPLPVLDAIRQQISRIPQNGEAEDGIAFHRTDIDYFSAARIFVTFKVKLAEHFPEGVPSDTFDFLVDLLVHEWLSRRVGADRAGELGMARAAALSPRIQHAAALGFITIEPDPDSTDMRIVALTRSGRARLNVFFDYMASYISVL